MMRFTEYLKSFGLSKGQFAQMAGVDRNTVSRWGESPPEIVMMWCRERYRHNEFCRKVREIPEWVV